MAPKKNTSTTDAADDFSFSGEQFTADKDFLGVRPPIAQILNPVYQPEWGICISEESAIQSGFKPDDGWQFKSVTFGKGSGRKEVPCYISQTPRMLVLNRSSLFLETKKTQTSNGQRLPYSRELSQELGNTAIVTSYMSVIFLGSDGTALSEGPLRLKCAKSAGAQLSSSYSKFIAEAQKAYIKSSGKQVNRSGKFYAHAIFCPIFQVEDRGTEEVGISSVCCTKGYVPPSPQNLKGFLIPASADLSTDICRWVDETQDWVNMLANKDDAPDAGEVDGAAAFIEEMKQCQSLEELTDTWENYTSALGITDQSHPLFPGAAEAFRAQRELLNARQASKSLVPLPGRSLAIAGGGDISVDDTFDIYP